MSTSVFCSAPEPCAMATALPAKQQNSIMAHRPRWSDKSRSKQRHESIDRYTAITANKLLTVPKIINDAKMAVGAE